MLDLVHRSQKVLGEVPRGYIMMGTFDLKLEGRNDSKDLLSFSNGFIFFTIFNVFYIFNMSNRSVSLKYPYLDTKNWSKNDHK